MPAVETKENLDRVKRIMTTFDVSVHAGDALYIVRKDGVIVDANALCLEVFGMEGQDMVGKTVKDLWELEIFNTTNNFFFGYDDRSATQLLRELNGVDLQEGPTSIDNAPMLSYEVIQRKKPMCGITRLGQNDNVVMIMGIPLIEENGETNYVLTFTRDLSNIMELRKQITKAQTRLHHLRKQQFDENFVGNAQNIANIKQLIGQVADSEATVLIYGETGTGKEVIAKEIYLKGSRSEKPYIRINCGAIPEALFESELFGYEKGAFTGATQSRKIGLLEMADGGTVLLDEIGEMPIMMQPKLLRALQEREIRRIGGTANIPINIRVMATTNRNLKEMISKGTFREDLYYRLNVVSIKVPPLRERREDIPPLAYRFLVKFNKRYKKDKYFDTGAMELLMSYEWPGNVRDLENTIERLCVIGIDNMITVETMAPLMNAEQGEVISSSETLKEAVDKIERHMIEQALKQYKSSRKAAAALGVSQPTVLRKAKALNIHCRENQ